jgi:hypothetical protein
LLDALVEHLKALFGFFVHVLASSSTGPCHHHSRYKLTFVPQRSQYKPLKPGPKTAKLSLCVAPSALSTAQSPPVGQM